MDFGRGAAAGGVSLSAGPGSPYIPSESVVFLLSSHGLFLSAEPSGRVVADKEEPKEGETWYMTRTNQRVTLMSAHGKYLCAEPSGRLVADRDRPVVWEYFLIESHGSLVAFRSHHGKYVCAEPNYEVLANRIAVETYECWDVIPVLGYSLQPPTSRRPVIDHCQSLPIPPHSPTHQPQAHYGHHQQPQNQNQPQNQPHSAEHAYLPPPAHYHQPTSHSLRIHPTTAITNHQPTISSSSSNSNSRSSNSRPKVDTNTSNHLFTSSITSLPPLNIINTINHHQLTTSSRISHHQPTTSLTRASR
ncbi:fascin subfamily protein [Acanthamoeba castellanii str. Neff]|uniref:Fascin subfamily protein n=1 Tax=Acanthamoeba castellanii (strain ATCC 30010 / Neff) TaxID=1257118 RepID=L8GD25_ACACF|nr:fascin subfamily protein [Acanthamoeba castellanii str. Neff]ELR10967.1 fascin subfamily protein [Acanthamoeba castellanii str. Neff]